MISKLFRRVSFLFLCLADYRGVIDASFSLLDSTSNLVLSGELVGDYRPALELYLYV